MTKLALFSFAATLICAFCTCLSAVPVYADTASDKCAPIEFVFARGSGDTNGLARDAAANSFHDALTSSLSGLGVQYHEYYLGTESYGGYQYPHIAINGSIGALATSMGAKVSGGDGFSYGLSVKEGTRELKNYLDIRMSDSQCPNSHFIISGFSQGAQVIGETLFKLTDSQLNKIAYVALFGDPKLNLPEGDTYTYGGKLLDDIRKTNPDYAPSEPISPDACYGVNASPWRTMIDNCHAYAGQLGARSPYVPKSIESRVHLWCHQNDGICDSTQSIFGDGHNYTDEAGIHMAVNEALFTTGIIPIGSLMNINNPTAKYDISFITPMHCTPLFRFPLPIPQLKVPYTLLDIANHNKTKLRLISEFFYDSFDSEHRDSTIQLINSERRSDAQLILYYVDGHNCLDEYVGESAYYPQTLAKKNLLRFQPQQNLDTPPWDPIILSEVHDDPTICTMTINTCQMITPSSDDFALAKLGITDSPHIVPLVNSYTTLTNQPVTYTVKTLDTTNNYTTYTWDFNSDDQPDMVTSTPSIQHTYVSPYDGTVSVTASTDGSSQSASTTFHQIVLANTPTSPLPTAPHDVAIQKTSLNEASVTWEPVGSAPGGWSVRVNGFPLGRVDEAQHYLTISDIDFSSPVTISIAGLSADYQEGEAMSATIEPSSSNNNPDLSRRGSDVDKLITAYELGKEVPDRTISLSDDSQANLSPTTDTPNAATQTQQRKTTSVHRMNPLYVVGFILVPLVIIGSAVFITLKIKK